MRQMVDVSTWLATTCEQITLSALEIALGEVGLDTLRSRGIDHDVLRNHIHEYVRGQITEAIEANPPELRFTPIVHLESGAFIAHEARHDRSTIGLRSDLELDALRATLQELEHLPSSSFVCVSVSNQLIGDARLEALIAQFPADRLVVEVVGMPADGDYRVMRDDLARLRRHGVRLAITDAAVELTNPSCVRALEPDIIKIDVGPAQRLATDLERRAMVAEVVQVSRRFGAFVIAEGIETTEQITVAQELGVDAGQGLLLCTP